MTLSKDVQRMRVSHLGVMMEKKNLFAQKAQQVQRPWGISNPGMSEEQQETRDKCGMKCRRGRAMGDELEAKRTHTNKLNTGPFLTVISTEDNHISEKKNYKQCYQENKKNVRELLEESVNTQKW